MTLEFQASLKEDNTLNVPADVASHLKGAGQFRVLVLLTDDENEDEDWRRFGMEQFLKGYAESDSIYDDL